MLHSQQQQQQHLELQQQQEQQQRSRARKRQQQQQMQQLQQHSEQQLLPPEEDQQQQQQLHPPQEEQRQQQQEQQLSSQERNGLLLVSSTDNDNESDQSAEQEPDEEQQVGDDVVPIPSPVAVDAPEQQVGDDVVAIPTPLTVDAPEQQVGDDVVSFPSPSTVDAPEQLRSTPNDSTAPISRSSLRTPQKPRPVTSEILKRQLEQIRSEMEIQVAALSTTQSEFEEASCAADCAREEITEIHSMQTSWRQAAADRQRELLQQQAEVMERQLKFASVESSEARAFEAAEMSEMKRYRRQDLEDRRVQSLRERLPRLHGQQLAQESMVQQQSDEWHKLTAQLQELSESRDSLRETLQHARQEASEAEHRARVRSEAAAQEAAKQKVLERQVAQLRAEANGLRAQLSLPGSQLSNVPDSSAQAVNLQLQKKIVAMRLELRSYDEEAETLRSELRTRSQRAVA